MEKEIKNPRLKIVLMIIALLVVVIFFIGAIFSKTAVEAYYDAKSARDNITKAQEYIEVQNFSAAQLLIEESLKNFNSASENLDKISWVRTIPYAGRQYKAAKHLVRSGVLIDEAMVSVFGTMVQVIEPLSGGEKNFNDLSVEEKQEMLKKLQRSTPDFQLAVSNISLAELEMEKVPEKYVLSQINEAVATINEYMPLLKDVFEGGRLATKFLPELAGYPAETNYLLLFQNNAELRPGGGFIGSYGVITTKDAELANIFTDDTYNLDKKSEAKIEMPWQIPVLLSPIIDSWFFRDSGWTPDYPTNAEKADWFYHIEGGEVDEFGGVIAITPTFIEYLLEITGPVKIPDNPKEFTSENVTDLLQYYVEQHFAEIGLPEEYRKNIIGELANIVVDRLFKLPKEKWGDLFKVVGKSMNEKHFLMYFHNDEIQDFIESQGWAGEVVDVLDNQDYMMVVDSNMAARKTDYYMERTWNYNIDFTGEKPKVKLDLVYKNTAPGFSWKYTRYRSWTRVYAPLGSNLSSVEGNEKGERYYGDLDTDYEVTEELDKTAFGTFINVEPGEEKTITFNYELPKDSSYYLKNNYNLIAQKQAGTLKPYINVNMILPNDVKKQSLEGEDYKLETDGNSVRIESNLLIDRNFYVNVNE